MGNKVSMCFSVHSILKAKIIDGKGNLKQVELPIKAAEVMLEETGYIISRVNDLQRTHRISAMRADDELEPGVVYMLVPVSRAHSKVTEKDIAIIEAATCEKKKKSSRRKRSSAKVLPDEIDKVRDENEGDEFTVLSTNDLGFPGLRFKDQKHWSPVLEAIAEVY